jgi:hypothetical protein
MFQIYTAVRYNQYGNEPWEHIVMWVSRKPTPAPESNRIAANETPKAPGCFAS